jgi:hypothetical protein
MAVRLIGCSWLVAVKAVSASSGPRRGSPAPVRNALSTRRTGVPSPIRLWVTMVAPCSGREAAPNWALRGIPGHALRRHGRRATHCASQHAPTLPLSPSPGPEREDNTVYSRVHEKRGERGHRFRDGASFAFLWPQEPPSSRSRGDRCLCPRRRFIPSAQQDDDAVRPGRAGTLGWTCSSLIRNWANRVPPQFPKPWDSPSPGVRSSCHLHLSAPKRTVAQCCLCQTSRQFRQGRGGSEG